jgi:hypothetical protein
MPAIFIFSLQIPSRNLTTHKPESFQAWEQGSHAKPHYVVPRIERTAMQDVVMLLFTAIFFALAVLYVMACQKLR